jgi:hypothetical protein
MNGSIDHLLRELRQTAAVVSTARFEGVEGLNAAEAFLDDVYALGLAMGLNPALGDAPEVRGAIRDTAPLAVSGVEGLSRWVAMFENCFIGTWEWSWEPACHMRSALQFALDLYRGTALEVFYDEYLPHGEVDAQLRSLAPYEGRAVSFSMRARNLH